MEKDILGRTKPRITIIQVTAIKVLTAIATVYLVLVLPIQLYQRYQTSLEVQEIIAENQENNFNDARVAGAYIASPSASGFISYITGLDIDFLDRRTQIISIGLLLSLLGILVLVYMLKDHNNYKKKFEEDFFVVD